MASSSFKAGITMERLEGTQDLPCPLGKFIGKMRPFESGAKGSLLKLFLRIRLIRSFSRAIPGTGKKTPIPVRHYDHEKDNELNCPGEIACFEKKPESNNRPGQQEHRPCMWVYNEQSNYRDQAGHHRNRFQIGHSEETMFSYQVPFSGPISSHHPAEFKVCSRTIMFHYGRRIIDEPVAPAQDLEV
jgi:hypothetical protein